MYDVTVRVGDVGTVISRGFFPQTVLYFFFPVVSRIIVVPVFVLHGSNQPPVKLHINNHPVRTGNTH